jgi:hypothetical protein
MKKALLLLLLLLFLPGLAFAADRIMQGEIMSIIPGQCENYYAIEFGVWCDGIVVSNWVQELEGLNCSRHADETYMWISSHERTYNLAQGDVVKIHYEAPAGQCEGSGLRHIVLVSRSGNAPIEVRAIEGQGQQQPATEEEEATTGLLVIFIIAGLLVLMVLIALTLIAYVWRKRRLWR